MRILQLLETKRDNEHVATTPRKEDTPTMRNFIFNPNNTYCVS